MVSQPFLKLNAFPCLRLPNCVAPFVRSTRSVGAMEVYSTSGKTQSKAIAEIIIQHPDFTTKD